uniref:Uncharacterized protein n=1 Tax=Caenorhabditis japonica TaxID=281687 RepID=A0A8R1HZP1_CAEJA
MKVPMFIAEIVSEFAGFHHTPDFKCSRSTCDSPDSETKSATNSRRQSTESRHSINIPVGVHDISNVTHSEAHARQRFVKKMHVSPSISRMANLGTVQEKLQRVKRSASLDVLRKD